MIIHRLKEKNGNNLNKKISENDLFKELIDKILSIFEKAKPNELPDRVQVRIFK